MKYLRSIGAWVMLCMLFALLPNKAAAQKPNACSQRADALELLVSPTDFVVCNADLITMSNAPLTFYPSPKPTAFSVSGGRIIIVGTNEDVLASAPANARVIDAEGRTIMPGFVDAHNHILDAPSFGATLAERQAVALRNGITTLGILSVYEGLLEDLQAFAVSGDLRLRTSLYLGYNTNCGDLIGEWYLDHPINPPKGSGWERLRVSGVKIFADGGSCNSPSFTRQIAPDVVLVPPYVAVSELKAVIRRAQSAGYQVAIHAIGDRAIDVALDGIASALDGEPNTYRHRIEHNSVIRPDQLPRYGEIGIVPTILADYPSCTPFGEPLYEAYQAWEWPYSTLIAANPHLHVAWHGDAPYHAISPLDQLYGFVTRNDIAANGSTCEALPHLKQGTIPAEEALYRMTLESAYALLRETEVGSLEAGKYADFIVLSSNPLHVDESDIKDIEVLATFVDGVLEWCDVELCSTSVE